MHQVFVKVDVASARLPVSPHARHLAQLETRLARMRKNNRRTLIP